MTASNASVTAPLGRALPGRRALASRPGTHAGTARKSMRERDRSGYLFVAPFAVATGLFLVLPTLYGLWMSFTEQASRAPAASSSASPTTPRPSATRRSGRRCGNTVVVHDPPAPCLWWW